MFSNAMTNLGIGGAEAYLSVRAISELGGGFELSDPLSSQHTPVGTTFAAVNFVLGSAMGIHEKPRVVQVAFPFFSGLAGVMAMRGMEYFLGVSAAPMLGAYAYCSVLMAGVALVKVIAKTIFRMQAEIKEESKPQRVFNYVLVGATSVIPATSIGIPLDPGYLLPGIFFGLAQVFVTTLLGAHQKEGCLLHGFLPCITSVLPFALVVLFRGVFPPIEWQHKIGSVIGISLVTALVGTVATHCFTSKPQLSTQKSVGETDHNVQRGIIPVDKGLVWEKTPTGWKQKNE